MNVNPGGQQRKLHDTVIPLNNPDPAPGKEDTHSQIQQMSFPDDHPDSKLRGKPKGFKAVLQERKSVWDKYTSACLECGTKVVGKCASCTKSQTHKDAERHVVLAEATGQCGIAMAEDMAIADTEIQSTPDDEWCCMYQVLALQEDFQSEKLLIQSIIEDAGHVCLFLPRFHCELNLIGMLWGYGKYCAHISHLCMICFTTLAFRLSQSN
jgi:hypothetical protein